MGDNVILAWWSPLDGAAAAQERMREDLVTRDDDIRAAHLAGASLRRIATELQMPKSTVHVIVRAGD